MYVAVNEIGSHNQERMIGFLQNAILRHCVLHFVLLDDDFLL